MRTAGKTVSWSEKVAAFQPTGTVEVASTTARGRSRSGGMAASMLVTMEGRGVRLGLPNELGCDIRRWCSAMTGLAAHSGSRWWRFKDGAWTIRAMVKRGR
ncbi:hypothetical protein L1987_69224 [Smallanthus sonchifolius]|uniref:Uncharacterized protein n=1 Tax=Smallanthus sonchifolius TaxID=185202 RepID=A0ACB9B640_9ASTR|nr:hypothetical protein L1987_69224 [Smallanthus sonchifolius]